MVRPRRAPDDGCMTNTHAITTNKQLVDDFIQRLFTKGDLTAVDD